MQLKPLIERGYQVLIDPQAYANLLEAIQECPTEIGFLATAFKKEYSNGCTYTIKQIFIPKQTVSGAECELDADDQANVIMQHIQNGGSANDFRCWIHSHVNMTTSPSGTDTTTFADYIKNSEEWYMMIIMNKKNEINIHVADKKENVYITGLNMRLLPSIDIKEELKKLEAIKLPALKTYGTGYHYGRGKCSSCGCIIYTDLYDGKCWTCSTKKNSTTKAKPTTKKNSTTKTMAYDHCIVCGEKLSATIMKEGGSLCEKCELNYMVYE